MNPWLLLGAALLLSVERVCYVLVWRAPDAFRAWCARSILARSGEPIDVLAALFVGFKLLQIAVFLAWCYVHGGGTLWPATPPWSGAPLWSGAPPWPAPPRPATSGGWVPIAGLSLIAGGQLLSASVFSRLGKAGVFYGNKLGRDVPWCDTFPFTWFKHPQYVGTVLSIWGFFLVMRFPAPDWFALPALETVYYVAGAYLEQDRHAAGPDVQRAPL